MSAQAAAAPRAKRVVVVDGSYDSYETERRTLAPLGASVAVEPCDRDAARAAAFRGETPRHWVNRWAD